MKQRIHFVHKDIIDPNDPISITIIGMGGTGTRLIQELVRMNIMLLKLDHVGIHVTVLDGSKISDSNIGRQFYYAEDIGKFKAQVITERVNSNYGFNWSCVNNNLQYSSTALKTNLVYSNIIVSCVDKMEPRIMLNEILYNGLMESPGYHNSDKEFYSIDCGNSFSQGQVICSTIFGTEQPIMKEYKTISRLKSIFDIFNKQKLKEAEQSEDKEASCSTYEALQRQDPFINSTIASLCAQIIWKLIRNHSITEHGYFVNLEDSTPIVALKV